MFVKHADDVSDSAVEAGSGTTKQVLISSREGPHFAMRRFGIQPGGGMPEHTNQVEHEQYVLSGRAQVGIQEEVHKVQPGDVVLIPAGVPYWYKNTGNKLFVFLCLVPNQPDHITILESQSDQT